MPEVNVDFPYMLKAVLNVIDNALRYSPDGSPIEIEASCIGNKVRVSVRDHGYGILKKILGGFFDKFYRFSTLRMYREPVWLKYFKKHY